MMLYITATKNVVSTAIVVEREEPGHAYKVQRPVYYISEVLTESKITVVTNFPLQDILRNKDATGRISKWE